MNPSDPLRAVSSSNAQELFERMGQVCDGFSLEDVMNAAANVIMNGIRQNHATQMSAEAHFDEFTAKMKQVLLDTHYNSQGRRQGIFPFPQNINVPHFVNKQKF